ncbi:TPA: hypothetical protein ACGF3Z_003518 [Vibrio cholerae]
MENRKIGSTSLCINFLAMLGSVIAAYYSSVQSQSAKDSYVAALEQLNIQKDELLLAKDTYAASLEQLQLYKEQIELQKEQFAADQRYSYVISSDSKRQLTSQFKHGEKIDLAFINNSKHTVGYRVAIISSGFGIYWDNGKIPKHLEDAIYLDGGNIIVSPEQWYRNSFVIHHGAQPAQFGQLEIIINGQRYALYKYEYDNKYKVYVYKNS